MTVTAPESQAELALLASELDMDPSNMNRLWRDYCQRCGAWYQSPTLPEFARWLRGEDCTTPIHHTPPQDSF